MHAKLQSCKATNESALTATHVHIALTGFIAHTCKRHLDCSRGANPRRCTQILHQHCAIGHLRARHTRGTHVLNGVGDGKHAVVGKLELNRSRRRARGKTGMKWKLGNFIANANAKRTVNVLYSTRRKPTLAKYPGPSPATANWRLKYRSRKLPTSNTVSNGSCAMLMPLPKTRYE